MTTIQLENLSSTNWLDWHRVTVHQRPSWDAAYVGTRKLVVGQPVGIVGWGIDVHGSIEGGQRITLDLATARPTSHITALPPDMGTDPAGYFGLPAILGVPFVFKDMQQDGACFKVRLETRIGYLHALLTLRYYPPQNRMNGVLRLTASDVSTPDLFYELPEPLLGLPRGFRFADGQCPSLLVQWQRDTRKLVPWVPKVTGRGIDTVGWLGNPARGGFDYERWLASRHQEAVDALTSWRLQAIGITPNAAVAGDQDDAGFAQGFESFYGGTLKGVQTNWLCAKQWSKRPCHHLNRDGSIVDPEAHGAIYWNGRPWSLSPNKFNKPRELADWDCSGWYGPDLEHHFMHRLAGSYELTQCPGDEEELRHLAFVYLGSETTDERLATSKQFVARALGWNSLVAAHLYRLLPDRALAERVKTRWHQRAQMHWQKWGPHFWDVRQTPSESLWLRPSAAPYYCMLYQMAVGAFGVYAAAKVLGAGGLGDWAASAARLVVDWAWDQNDTEWEIAGHLHPNGSIPIAPESYDEGVTAHRSGFYAGAWLPLALWVALDSQPQNERARRLYGRVLAMGCDWYRLMDWTPPVRA